MKILLIITLCLSLGRADDVPRTLRLLIKEGRFIEAASASDRLISLDPKNVEALATKSQALSAFLDFDEALVLSQRALQQNQKSAEARLAKGIALMGLAIQNITLRSIVRVSQALDEMLESTKLDPGYGYAWFTLGLSQGKLPLLFGGSRASSIKCAENLKKIDRSWGLVLEGTLVGTFESWKQSESFFLESIKLGGSRSLAITAYLEVLMGDKTKDQLGLEDQKKYVHEVAKNLLNIKEIDVHALESLGDAFLFSGHPEEAWELMQLSIPKYKESSLLKLQSAKIASRSGLYLNEALVLIEEALLGPIEGGSGGREGGLVRQGQILKHLGKLIEAKKSFEEALEINPRHRGAQEGLANITKD